MSTGAIPVELSYLLFPFLISFLLFPVHVSLLEILLATSAFGVALLPSQYTLEELIIWTVFVDHNDDKI